MQPTAIETPRDAEAVLAAVEAALVNEMLWGDLSVQQAGEIGRAVRMLRRARVTIADVANQMARRSQSDPKREASNGAADLAHR